MSLWKRSIRQDDRSSGIFKKARNQSRKRRLHLENLEQRTLLSTYSISESYINGVPTVSETVNGTTTTHSNPTSPFVVNTGTGSNTVNIFNTSAHVAVTVNSLGSDTVNLGSGGSVQNILASVTVQSTSSHDTVNADDSADTTARTATLSTFSSGGSNWGTVTGLAPSAINFKYGSTSSVNLTTGTAIDLVDVLSTGVTTNISTSGGRDEINVGNAGNAQGILDTLNIENLQTYDTVNVYDSADTTARTATLSTSSSSGVNWGTITGLAPAAINYKYGSTSSVNIVTGMAADTVDVLSTGTTTNISSSGGADIINVGNAGSVQGILGRLYLQNPPSYDTVNVDDSADTLARTVTLNTFTSGAYNWGSITGLAPAVINFRYNDTSGVNLTTGSGADTVNVLATGTTSNISSSGGADIINVGNSGSVQGILGALYLQNPPSFDTVNVNDSTDTTARTTNLSTYSSGLYSWGSITGLAPASINFKYRDTSSLNLTTGMGSDIVNVLATGVTTNISTSGGLDTINIGNAGSVQGILGALYLQNPPSFDTVNVNDSVDPTGRTTNLSTYSSGLDSWGSIAGLAPASINFKYLDTTSVSLMTGMGADTVNILATGVTTDISSGGGLDTIIVGTGGSVQGILGALYLQNAPYFDAISISDYADGSARTASLSTYASGGSNWGLITGLAPALISFKYGDTLGPVNVSTIPGLVNWNVAASGMSGVTEMVVNDNSFPINSVPSEPTADVSYSPAPAGTPLFSAGTPSYLDVRQGVQDDCWLLASLAEVAARDPQIIRNMFIYDGTIVKNGVTLGLYTVRFFNASGLVVSVQVDTELPSGAYDDNIQNDLGTSCLWVALAEKAYAVANGHGYVTTNYPNWNSYDSLEFGFASWALHAITGMSASEFSVNPTNVAAAWNAGDFIVMDTDSPSSSLIVEDHSYAVVGYDSSNSLPFELFNPWGTDSSGWAPGHSGKIYGLFSANTLFISHNFSEQSIGTGATNGDHLATPADKFASSTALGGGYGTFGTIDITLHRPGRTVDAKTAAAHGHDTAKTAPLAAINVDLLFAGDSDVGLDMTMSGFNKAWGGRKF